MTARLVSFLTLVPALLALACDGSASAPAGVAQPSGIVVVQSDYTSASVSLVDPATGMVTRDNCINSGSTAPMLTTALSDDVVAASQPQPHEELALVDRKNATLTWIDPKSCSVLRQLSVGEGGMSNPQDLISVSATKAYVPRYAPENSDLLVIDPSTATITGRVDLQPYATPAAAPTLPRPTRGLFVRDRVYVVLGSLSADFKTNGAGRVVVIDPATDMVTDKIELPTLNNCGGISYVAAANALVVSCGGPSYAGGTMQLDAAGVAWIDLATTPPTVKVASAKPLGRASSPFDAVALDASTAFTITSGDDLASSKDELWAIDFAGGAPRKIYEAGGAYTLSGLVADPVHKQVFVADASDSAPKLHIFDVSNAAAPVLKMSVTTTATGLPPRYVSFY